MKCKLLSMIIGTAVVSTAAAMLACGEDTRQGEPDFYAYELTDVVMMQTGVNSFDFTFSADCGDDDVKVYFSDRDRIRSSDRPINVIKTVEGGKARFAFSVSPNLNEEYFLFVNGNSKQAVLPLTVPSMFPTMDARSESAGGGAVFNFNYTPGVSWSSFCDPEGKAVYVSSEPTFDMTTAEVVQKNVLITVGECSISKAVYDNATSKYYFSVTTAKNGLLTIISSPVVAIESIKSQIESINAKLENSGGKPYLSVDIGVAGDSEIATSAARNLQLIVKNNKGDEIYVKSAEYDATANKAKIKFVADVLQKEGVWYDMCLAYRGAMIIDIPKKFNGNGVMGVSSITVDGKDSYGGDTKFAYKLVDWRPDSAPDDAAILKVYFEEDNTRYGDEFCTSYSVSMSVTEGEAVLSVTLTLKPGVTSVPKLIITAGAKKSLGEVAASRSGNQYVYSMRLANILSIAGKWYDVRLLFDGRTYVELYKDDCITSADFLKVCTAGGKSYKFQEWNGILKVYYEAA